jgi:hypothetical protein
MATSTAFRMKECFLFNRSLFWFVESRPKWNLVFVFFWQKGFRTLQCVWKQRVLKNSKQQSWEWRKKESTIFYRQTNVFTCEVRVLHVGWIVSTSSQKLYFSLSDWPWLTRVWRINMILSDVDQLLSTAVVFNKMITLFILYRAMHNMKRFWLHFTFSKCLNL